MRSKHSLYTRFTFGSALFLFIITAEATFAQERLIGMTHRDGFEFSFVYNGDKLIEINSIKDTFNSLLEVHYDDDQISSITSSSNDNDPDYTFELFFQYHNLGHLDRIDINEIGGDNYLKIQHSNQSITGVHYHFPHSFDNEIPFYKTSYYYDGERISNYLKGELVDYDWHHTNGVRDFYKNEKLATRAYSSNSGNYMHGIKYSLDDQGNIKYGVYMNFEDPDIFPSDSIQFEIDKNYDALNVGCSILITIKHF